MAPDPIRWLSLAQNYSGGRPRVVICRKSKESDVDLDLPRYKPTPASMARVLALIEKQSRDYVLSISCGSTSGRLSILLHAGLKRLSPEYDE